MILIFGFFAGILFSLFCCILYLILSDTKEENKNDKNTLCRNAERRI